MHIVKIAVIDIYFSKKYDTQKPNKFKTLSHEFNACLFEHVLKSIKQNTKYMKEIK